jgi:hypothetical protein
MWCLSLRRSWQYVSDPSDLPMHGKQKELGSGLVNAIKKTSG